MRLKWEENEPKIEYDDVKKLLDKKEITYEELQKENFKVLVEFFEYTIWK